MRSFHLLSFFLLVAACADGFTAFPVTPKAQSGVSSDVTIIRLDDNSISSFAKPQLLPQRSSLSASMNWEYTVGIGDILSVIVFERPELTLPTGTTQDANLGGYTVQADGAFFFPYIGQVDAKGRTIQDIRQDISVRLAEFITNPQVEVRVSQFNSQRVNVAGEVKTPSRLALNTVALTMLEAISAAGGFTESADKSNVKLQRRGAVYTIDVTALLEHGYAQNNPVMRNGDILTIPRKRVEEAYLLGEVLRPAAVDLSLETVTLTQALTRQGGVEGIRADARGIFVFRLVNSKMTVFQLDTSSPTGLLLGTRFVLEPGDVVYVTRSPLQRWNDTITRLLPSVQATVATQAVAN